MTNIEEIWKDVPNTNGILRASNTGKVFNTKKNKLSHQSISSTGYYITCFKSKTRKVHRLIAAAFLGESNLIVDHINGNRLDNNIDNLRYCTQRENLTYSNVNRPNKTSRYVGVHYKPKHKNWRACIWVNKNISLGSYKSEDDAYRAYVNAYNKYFPQKSISTNFQK